MDYALLGDDVVIADENVGPVYASLVKDIGVSISKLLWMNSRCLIQGIEFAKRFLVNQLTFFSPARFIHFFGLSLREMKIFSFGQSSISLEMEILLSVG